MPKSLILTGVTGSRVGIRTVLAGRTNTIGSSQGCDIVLPDRMVAPRHAEVRQVLERWFVAPLDPSARIFVNGEPVAAQGRILEGDLVTFGAATFKASLAETIEQEIGAGPAQAGKQSVPRLGEYLLRRGIVSQRDLDQAVQRQSDLARQGRNVPIGDILYDLGYINRYQLEQALQDQRGDFLGRFRD